MGTSQLAGGFSALDPCVHCGFCLPACPTYQATGDEADSPRGRIVLMRALERGEIPASDSALRQHLDACLGCRGCEPVCPSGVGYGRGLEAARELLARSRGLTPLARAVLAIFSYAALWRALCAAGRVFRDTGLAARFAGSGRLGFTMGMLASSRGRQDGRDRVATSSAEIDMSAPSVALFRGCVMEGLFAHVHGATKRTLAANGYRVVEVGSQVCCGALHEHAGDREGARRLARANLDAFSNGADYIVVNSAGCGAILRDYDHLVGEPGRVFASKVRDVTELLAERGPRPGGSLEWDVAYDAPCHLQYAQKVLEAPLTVLRAVPGIRLRQLPGSDRCCGSAGIFSLLQPEMSRAVLADKVATIRAADPAPTLIATGNPGCLMQIGAGLRAAHLPVAVAHPVEVLDWSYRVGGVYGIED